MKILHIIDSGGLYGAEIMLLNLMQEQIASGIVPMLASIGDTGVGEKPIEKEARFRNFKFKTFRMKPGPNYVGAFNVLKFARNEGVDILHSHGYKGNILFGFLPRWVRRIPIVSTIHGWTWNGGMTRMLLYEWLDSLSLLFVDRVIAVNSVMKEHPRIKNRRTLSLDVVPNGIPLLSGVSSKDKALLNQEIVDFCRQGYTLGAIGRLSPEKGFESLLEAVSDLSLRGREIRLVILGEGELRQRLESVVMRLGIESKVLMPGYVQNAKQYLPLFNLFAMPSLTEGLPMVLLEAMQAGVPVIATRVGGIPEVLDEGKCGLLIEPAHLDALVEGISEVLGKTEVVDQRVREAKLRVTELYSSKTMADNYSRIYMDVSL